MRRSLLALATSLLLPLTALAETPFIILQSTTSTQNSGLYEHLLPLFQAESGVEVRVVAVGTGQAIKNAGNCDGDVLLVHAKPAEEAFVAAGHGLARHDVMYNDFVLVGPSDDPAGISGETDIAVALAAVANSRAPFTSRGDESGTHRKELALWEDAETDLSGASGSWYRETGSGMGATLNVASAMSAYALTDRATWIAFANKGTLEILVQGDPRLFNQYGVILVSSEHCPRVKSAEGQRFIDWLLSPTGQAAIADFEVAGQQLFVPNAEQ
ncbi:MAG: substrate-binding domain-containing protein [Pseudomonadota bacterium]